MAGMVCSTFSHYDFEQVDKIKVRYTLHLWDDSLTN